MNVFFDVDYTILSLDNVLRSGTREVFRALVEDGHAVYVWSGSGLRCDVVREHGLDAYVSGVFVKPTYGYVERLDELGVDVPVDFVVDDHPQVVEAFGGVCIDEFWFGDQPDDGLWSVREAVARAGLDEVAS